MSSSPSTTLRSMARLIPRILETKSPRSETDSFGSMRRPSTGYMGARKPSVMPRAEFQDRHDRMPIAIIMRSSSANSPPQTNRNSDCSMRASAGASSSAPHVEYAEARLKTITFLSSSATAAPSPDQLNGSRVIAADDAARRASRGHSAPGTVASPHHVEYESVIERSFRAAMRHRRVGMHHRRPSFRALTELHRNCARKGKAFVKDVRSATHTPRSDVR